MNNRLIVMAAVCATAWPLGSRAIEGPVITEVGPSEERKVDLPVEDPHAIIPADPEAAIVADADGTLRIETRGSASALALTPPAPSAGAQASGTIATTPAPAGTASGQTSTTTCGPSGTTATGAPCPDPAAAGATAQAPAATTTAPSAGVAASGEAQAQATPPAASEQTVIVEGEEQRAAFGTPSRPTTRSPDELRQASMRERRPGYMNSITVAPRAMLEISDDSDLEDTTGNLALQLDHVLARPLSLVLGGQAGMRDRGPGLSDETTFGADLGLNLFLAGGNNEGFYVGPRGHLAISGNDDAVEDGDFADRLGYGGEVGYRFITSGGFTGGLALGAMNQTIGTVSTRTIGSDGSVSGSPTDRETFGYGALHFGWSW